MHDVSAHPAKHRVRNSIWYCCFHCCHDILISMIVTELHVVSADQTKYCHRDIVWDCGFDCSYQYIINMLLRGHVVSADQAKHCDSNSICYLMVLLSSWYCHKYD